MSKQTIISIIVIIVGIVGLVWWSKWVDSNKLSAQGSEKYHLARTEGILTSAEPLYDFGTISMINGKVSTIFKISNTSTEDIKVPSITTSCMCTTAYIINNKGEKSRPFGMPGHGGAVAKANAIVKAGETLNLEVVYDPNAHGPAGVGFIDRFVYLDDEYKNRIQLEIKANVTP